MKMYKKVSSDMNFVDREKETVKFWKENEIFEKSIEERKDDPTYTFYDGPPTANGKPHIGHVLTRVIKDMIPRYQTMKGHKIIRKAGWDTHGLPVELEVEKMLGLDGKEQIEEYGMEPFIKKCKESVWKYKGMWEDFSDTVGFWADMENPYITYDNNFIESVWWALKQIWDKGLLYKGFKIVPYCPRCGTPLSAQEVAQGYKDVKERSAIVRFKLVDAANVKDSAIVVNAVQEVAVRIEDLQKSVNEAYANETLATVYDEVLAPVVEIDTAIVDMVEMVLDYQQKVTANEEAYTRLTADIAAVQAKLDAAKTTIETDYAEVAEQFMADIAALQEDIDSISNEVKGLYDEVKLTAESQIDATAIEAGIEKVLADAAAALATEEAKKANEEAYTRLTADIAAVQAKLDAAKTTIETDYAEVAEQFMADIAALQEDIDSISNEVKGLYDEVKLTAESQIDATAIEAGIEKVLADAKKAHEGSSIAGVKGPEGAELLGIYTVSGKRVAAPLKGQVNIFKYSDGTVKKFYMK